MNSKEFAAGFEFLSILNHQAASGKSRTPSTRAMEAAQDVKEMHRYGLRPHEKVIASFIDYTTRLPQLDAIAKAAAELIAAWPVADGGRPSGQNQPAPLHRSAVKLARALKSLANQDEDINPRALTNIKRLTARSLAA